MQITKNLQANLIPIRVKNENVNCSFYTKKFDGAVPLLRFEFPSDHIALKNSKIERLYTDFVSNDNADFNLELDLKACKIFSKHYYRHLLTGFFNEQHVVSSIGFSNDLTLFLPVVSSSDEYDTYEKIILRLSINDWFDGLLLMVVAGGRTKIYRTSLLQLDTDISDLCSHLLYQQHIYHRNWLPEAAKNDYGELFPLLSNRMKVALGMSVKSLDISTNPYQTFRTRIMHFASQWLSHANLSEIFDIRSDNWLQIPNDKIFNVKPSSNDIILGYPQSKVVLTPKRNLGNYGPYRLPVEKEVKFITIFEESSRDKANQLFTILNSYTTKINHTWQKDSHKSLYDFIRISFHPDAKNAVYFNSTETLLEEVKDKLDAMEFDTMKYNYVAIYLSPIERDTTIESQKKIYYLLKELLLHYNVSSQVIDIQKIANESFRKYYIHNIAPALLAKAGGIPWQLNESNEKELIVGVGAYRSVINGLQYIGSAFSFNRNGSFRQFNCVAKDELFVLAGEIREFIKDHVSAFGKPERLIIHFYKNLSKRELVPINKMLFDLGLEDIPVFIVSINSTLSNDDIAFDMDHPDLIPVSGTILQISKKNYLLFNNTRYGSPADRVESYYFPLKIKLSCTDPKQLNNMGQVNQLLGQVYQFSRIYWKSVKQQNLPVTVSYPAALAKIFSHFEDQALNDFGQSNLWFL
jgi:hypothetical protein